jgi:hypothetical protein
VGIEAVGERDVTIRPDPTTEQRRQGFVDVVHAENVDRDFVADHQAVGIAFNETPAGDRLGGGHVRNLLRGHVAAELTLQLDQLPNGNTAVRVAPEAERGAEQQRHAHRPRHAL